MELNSEFQFQFQTRTVDWIGVLYSPLTYYDLYIIQPDFGVR